MLKNFVVYRSSAGSGKTFTLVKEYLRLALYDDKKLNSNYKRILAITFTNKAAAEMKERVISSLNNIANGEPGNEIGKLLCAELHISGEELQRRAKHVFNHLLHHYSDLSISTIDSFNHKIVKTFAHDLKLPVNFTIELDTRGFYEKVISSLFAMIGEDEYVSKLLQEYALGKARDNSAWDPERNIREFSELLHKEHSDEYIEKLKQFSAGELETFRKQFIDFIRHYKNTLNSESLLAIDLIAKNGLVDDDFIFKSSGPQKFFQKCKEGVATLVDANAPRINDAVAHAKWAGKAAAEKVQVIEKIRPRLDEIAQTLIRFIRENYAHYSLCELLSKQMYPLMLLKKIEEISDEQKQEERLVFISEFNKKIFDIITSEPTPFIYERLGDRYQHFLLDEFQDTSSLQWQNMLPLIDNSLSNGWFNLIVGDGKQSIYRWRNANVKQFSALPAVNNAAKSPILEERARALERNFLENFLITNYRSAKNIISFNNTLFDSLSATLLSEDHKTIYHNQAQAAHHTNEGYVTVSTGTLSGEEFETQTFTEIRSHISDALKSGYHYKDMCILCRKNAHGNAIAKFLMEQQIPIVSSDSLLLKNNLEINTVLCYLKYLQNNDDVISAAAVVNYLHQAGKMNKDELHLFLKDLAKGTSLFQIFKKCNIHFRENELALNNVFDNCVEFIKALQLTDTNYIYIRFFLDEVNEYLVLKNSTISSFFEWWESRSGKASLIIPENTNAVRIMTIHAGKGLEFPVVIIPYCNWNYYKAGDAWVNIKDEKVKLPVSVINLSKKVTDSGFEKELLKEQQDQVLDNLNLLYVAFTRAVERLHILSKTTDRNKGASVNQWIEGFMSAHHKESREGYYEIGVASACTLSHKMKDLPTYALEPLQFTTPNDVVRIKASYLMNNETVENAKRQGLLLHWLLSKVRSEEDVLGVLEAAVVEGEISREELAVFKALILAIIHHPDLSAFYEKGLISKQEAELVTQEGEILRPDRVIMKGEETILIDYKTGQENPVLHAKQLQKYARALQSMGHSSIRKYLVYVDKMNVMKVN
ncbi:MAG: UvrD-helicase domain-containing protein [bacterium]|nr:UvrD-helicase domain-containing protein [bacterium]